MRKKTVQSIDALVLNTCKTSKDTSDVYLVKFCLNEIQEDSAEEKSENVDQKDTCQYYKLIYEQGSRSPKSGAEIRPHSPMPKSMFFFPNSQVCTDDIFCVLT